MNEKRFTYSRRFIEDPNQVYKWKPSDVFTKIHWRSGISRWIKNVWCIHEDLLKIVIKFMNEKFLMDSRRFMEKLIKFRKKNFLIDSRRLIEDPDQVYEWKTFDVFTKIHEEMIEDSDQVYEWKAFDVFTKIYSRSWSSL